MTSPIFFRKKPVTVSAMLFDGSPESLAAVAAWMTELGHPGMGNVEADTLCIETLEGTLTASAGDWIIRGVAGEFYPCKPAIFEATYERAA